MLHLAIDHSLRYIMCMLKDYPVFLDSSKADAYGNVRENCAVMIQNCMAAILWTWSEAYTELKTDLSTLCQPAR